MPAIMALAVHAVIHLHGTMAVPLLVVLAVVLPAALAVCQEAALVEGIPLEVAEAAVLAVEEDNLKCKQL